MFDIFALIFTVLLILVLLLGIGNFIFILGAHIFNFFIGCIKCIKDKIPKKSNHDTCSICLEEVFNVPVECGHVFHTKCINKWLKNNDTCPNCRINII